MVETKTPTRDFKDTEYYEKYKGMIKKYRNKIITSIITQQGIDNEQKYTWWDVLKEVLKFVEWDMMMFQDLKEINPNREIMDKEQIEKYIEEEAKNLGIMQ